MRCGHITRPSLHGGIYKQFMLSKQVYGQLEFVGKWQDSLPLQEECGRPFFRGAEQLPRGME
eukprot:1159188-Pelagomonas_calceolata.AAC.5